jgi:capsular polysaccharide transport system permease protein
MPDSHESESPLSRVLPQGPLHRRTKPLYRPDIDDPEGELTPRFLREPSPELDEEFRKPEGARPPGRTAAELPPLPQRRPRSRRGTLLSFLLCVILPTALAGVYYYVFAADQYVAQFKFAVMEADPVLPGIPPAMTTTSPSAQMGGSAGGMAMMTGGMSTMGASSAVMQNYVVTDYLLSRQVVDELQKRINIRALYDNPLAQDDLWARFDKQLPMERFVRYWNRMVSATYDPMTGLADVTVRAFSPQDALLIASNMVALSEDLVNTIAKRPQLDSVRFAEGEVKRAEERLQRARDAMTEYRLQEGVIDPSGVLSTNIALVQSLRGVLIQQQSNLNTLLSQQQSPNSPMVQGLRAQVASTKEQLQKMEQEISKDREGNRVLTELVGKYERIDLERQYAQGALVAAQQALDQARANAAAQHLYLTPYVRPALPSSAIYPKRAQSVLLAGLAFFGIWIVGLMIARTVSEHA